MKRDPLFMKEADLCAAYIETLPDGWTAYAETAGWDILLVRAADGFQIGVQAKLKLNTDVILQCLENDGSWSAARPGPDCRAVLIPQDARSKLTDFCAYLGLVVITVGERQSWGKKKVHWTNPPLPSHGRSSSHEGWVEWCPTAREKLPDYVPDVVAGDSAPLQLTDWKIKAIKIAIIAETHGSVLRTDFKAISIDHRRWITAGWLRPENGVWVAGQMPDFKAQHPRVYDEIRADAEKWLPKRSA